MDPMTAITLGTTAYGTYTGYKANKSAGKAASSEANAQAFQMEANAIRARRAGVTRAAEVRRETNRLMSDAQAAQAASGFSASDAQAVQQRGDISGVGKYNELAYLYEAEMDARGLISQGAATRQTGRNQQSAYNSAATNSVISGMTSAFGVYKQSKIGKDPYRVDANSAPVFESAPAWTRP